jgi:hypothetical protein
VSRLLAELMSANTANEFAFADCTATDSPASARCPRAAPCCGSLSGGAEVLG